MQSTTWDVHGRRRLADAIRNGEPLAAVYNDLAVELWVFPRSPVRILRRSLVRPAHTPEAAVGWLQVPRRHLCRARRRRRRPGIQRPARQKRLACNQRQAGVPGRRAGSRPGYLQVEDGAPAPAAVPEPEPLPVRIVAMPDRLTETKIERDEKGNIAASLQIERDAHVEA